MRTKRERSFDVRDLRANHFENEDGALAVESSPPAFGRHPHQAGQDLRGAMQQAVNAWLSKSPSQATRECYGRDLQQFLSFHDLPETHLENLTRILPTDVSAWRDDLLSRGAANSTVVRKLTALRSLFSYLQVYGYMGANPAHGKFVKAPAVPRDGKTVGLSPQNCRRLLEAPNLDTPSGIRDRAILGVLAYSGCRVGELVRLKVGDFKTDGEHRVLQILGKGGKERVVPLHLEAVERLTAWLNATNICDDLSGPLFRPAQTPRGKGRDGFHRREFTTRAIERLVQRYVRGQQLDPAVTVHSFRVTALTTARERGAYIIDLQDFAGHADPRTTLTYIRSRDRLSKSPAYVLNY